MNLTYNEFIIDVVDRLYHWIQYYNEVYRGDPIEKEKYGIFVEFSTNYDYCINTGIYGSNYTKDCVLYNQRECMFFEGFEWTKEKLRNELDKVVLKIWKENETIYKLKRIEEDFK